MDNSYKILTRNNIFYDFFLNRKILDVKETISSEETVKRIIFLAKFSWRNHPGYFFDGRLENIVFDFGKNLGKYIDKENVENDIERIFPEKKDYTILHVATELGEVGGHTRVLYQFLKRYDDRNQILILTDQSLKNVPKWFMDGVGAYITIIALDTIVSLFERSYILRYVSTFCKTIILYQHPYDVIPIMAFAHDNCPPVLIENHSHSWFWLGTSIADLVFSHSSFHNDFTLKTRPVNNAYLFPCTQIEDLEDSFTIKDKAIAKRLFNMSEDTVCIITIGTPEKFIPNAHYNFFKTAKKIVDRFDNVRIYVIGVSEDPYLRNQYNLDTENIHFVGQISDPTPYYKAADICLDALPQPSLGGTWYSTLIGMSCPLHKYGAGNIFNTNNLSVTKLYGKYVGDLRTEEDYLDKLGFLINNPELRITIAREIRDEYLLDHSQEVFIRNLKKLLEFTRNMKHQHLKIPVGIFHYDADSAEIADTSSLQDIPGIFKYFENYFNIRDKINIILRLSTKLIFFTDILKLVRMSLKNRIKNLYYVLVGGI